MNDAPFQRYLVGGAVRDQLLGRPVNEYDWVVVGATPQQLTRRGYRQVGSSFPVYLDPDRNEEHALARTERKSGSGHKGFKVAFSPDVTLEEDLKRRDLTINAMACPDRTVAPDDLVDPYDGQADLAARQLRHVSGAFEEDPLRVLRVARFAAQLASYGFEVAPETLALMRRMSASGELETLPAERLWQETWKAMASEGPQRFVEVLHDCGALDVILPEVEALFGVPQPEQWHPEVDTGIHLLLCLKMAARLTDDPAVRFSVLTHDLGKGITPEKYLPSHRGHEATGVPLVKAVCERLRAPNAVADLAVKVCANHLLCHTALKLRPGRALQLLEDLDAFRKPDVLEQFVLACEADARGRTGLEDRDYPGADYLREVFAAARAVDTGPIIDAGYEGRGIAKQLRRQRIAAVAEVKARWVKDD